MKNAAVIPSAAKDLQLFFKEFQMPCHFEKRRCHPERSEGSAPKILALRDSKVLKGHGFSRAATARTSVWASAPEGRIFMVFRGENPMQALQPKNAAVILSAAKDPQLFFKEFQMPCHFEKHRCHPERSEGSAVVLQQEPIDSTEL